MFSLLDEAARVATKRQDIRTYYIGAIGIRGDGSMVHARNESATLPSPLSHAEARLSKRLDYGATVLVVRVNGVRNGVRNFALAYPCNSCLRFLTNRKVKRVYFTTGIDSVDWIDL